MDSFTGLKALRKTIELVLQKLNMYQDKMNEISREELLEIMGNNDLDLSWIASQESVDALRSEVNNCSEQIIAVRKLLDPWYGFEVGTFDDLNGWDYTFDETSKIVQMSKYDGTEEHVVMYDAYKNASGDVYRTKFVRKSGYMFGNNAQSNIKSFRFCDKITVDVNNFSYAFKGTSQLSSVDFGTVFKGCTITDIGSMFEESGIESIDLSNVGFGNCDMGSAFCKAYNLTDVDFEDRIIEVNMARIMFGINTTDPTEMMHLKNIRLNIKSTEGCDMHHMFSGCADLEHIDVSKWDTSNVTSFGSMFNHCESLTELDLTSFNTPNITSVMYMFRNCTNLQVVKISSKWSTTGADKTDWFEGAGCTGVTRV